MTPTERHGGAIGGERGTHLAVRPSLQPLLAADSLERRDAYAELNGGLLQREVKVFGYRSCCDRVERFTKLVVQLKRMGFTCVRTVVNPDPM